MREFQREERYIVVKIKDIDDEDHEDLLRFIRDLGIPTRECVVVEPDWPIYEEVWTMIERLEETRHGTDA